MLLVAYHMLSTFPFTFLPVHDVENYSKFLKKKYLNFSESKEYK
jgi:hypothetical protein